MKTYPLFECPPEPGDNPHPMQLAPFILGKFLHMPPGGLYAKWDEQVHKAVWFYSQERDYIFREPRRDLIIYEEHDRSRFRSLVFRFGDLCNNDGGLCGYVEFTAPESPPKRYVIHSSFYPEQGIGLWIAITYRDDKIPEPKHLQP